MNRRTPMQTWMSSVVLAIVLLVVAPPSARASGDVLQGRAWIDQNCDGVRDAGEPPLLHLQVYLFAAGEDGVVSTPDDQVIDVGSTVTTGIYAFQFGAPGITYRVTVRDRDRPLGFVPAPYHQGADPSIDNDLTLPDPSNPYYWSTGGFQLDAERTTTGIDLGVCRVPVYHVYLPSLENR